ncbi:MBG domain-containing protein [Herbaspirillum sp.]|uniref:MBG domain-containing protein n=1 Tax=Herbaspirillum sp. TaxID=1890675 RepID=UPI001B2F2AB2|nr:MBG domain-containing protein [Herbaspirillum sp.]MBO9538095.1 filamentous hemagglutinin N-terminal domain-containing protein [Herbaspirillum sp.]
MSHSSLNHIYRLVWSAAYDMWVAVAEQGRARGKKNRGKAARTLKQALLLTSGTMSGMALAGGLPTGANVVRGQASISQSGTSMLVSQTSKNAVLNWTDFSIGKGASVRFDNGNGATLNRVTGNLPSSINGQLSATGSLYLINRNGVVVGPNGVINAAGFMATTLDIRDDDFMAGSLHFQGDSRAGIVNLGTIHAASGDIALVAHTVSNEGSISAPNGKAELLAGQEIFLTAANANQSTVLVRLPNDGTAGTATGVTNTGLIEAAQARMEAAGGNLYALAINQSGVIRATGVSNLDGRIVLTADGGTVRQNGKLGAQNGDGSGGTILVGGDTHGANKDVANASQTIVTANASMDASAVATQGNGGRVVVWSDQNTSFAGSIAARGGEQGGDGGFVEVSGKHALGFRPGSPIDLSAKAGKTGTVLLDPDQIEVVGTVTGSNQIAADDIKSGLASANYLLETSGFNPAQGNGNITVSSSLSWNTASTLTLKAGNAININADITAPNGTLDLQAGRSAFVPSGVENPIDGGATLSTGNTITARTLRYGVNPAAAPSGYVQDPLSYTGNFVAYGDLRVGTLELDLRNGNINGMVTRGSNNAIGAVRSIGTGNLGQVDIVNHDGGINVMLQDAQSGPVNIVTPGDLTLEAGTQLGNTGSGGTANIVLASTGGNFINAAGSNAISGNLRYLIYTSTQAGTNKGSLTGTSVFGRTYDSHPPSTFSGDTVNRFLFSQANGVLQLTYSANNLSKVYGDNNPTLAYSISGLQTGDVLANEVTGAPTLSTTATMQSGVGTYTINISQGSLSSSTYGFNFVPGQLTVTQRPLNVFMDSFSRTYGSANPAFTLSIQNAVDGDAYTYWTATSLATQQSNAGTYSITAAVNPGNTGFANLANYAVTFHPGTLTITRAPLTVTVDPTSIPASILWGDQLNPNLAYTATGYMSWDTASTAGKVAFIDADGITAAPGIHHIGTSTNVGNNYYVSTLTGVPTVTVLRRPITITGNYNVLSDADFQTSHPGWIESFMVRRYDSNGILVLTPLNTPLPGGPQFGVTSTVPTLVSQWSDVTKTQMVVSPTQTTTSSIQPSAGSSMADVLRYYDPVIQPGTATRSALPVDPLPPLTLNNNTLINTNVTIDPQTVNVEQPTNLNLNPALKPAGVPFGAPPPVKYLVDQAFPDGDALATAVKSLLERAKQGGADGDAAKTILNRMPKELRDQLAALSAGDFDALLQKMLSGDAATVSAFMPLITATMTQQLKNGKLSPATEAALVQLINDQRSKTIASMDAQYNAIMAQASQDNASGLMTSAFTAPNIPDLVGTAYVKVATDQIDAALIGGSIPSAAALGGTLAGVIAVSVAEGGTAFYTTSAAITSSSSVAGIVVGAVIMSVMEGIKVAESTKNYDRYVAYKAANKSIQTLDGLNLSNPDNLLQLGTAMTALLGTSLGVKPQ